MGKSICCIYILVDSVDRENIRYVGQTTLTLPKRLKRHINSCTYEISYKNNWIKSLLKQGRIPEIKVIEIIDSDDPLIWDEREIYWISFYKKLGHRLTNTTLGGHGIRWSEEMKKKASKNRKGRCPSKQCLKAAADSRRGRPRSDKTKRKISESRKGTPAWNKDVPASPEMRKILQTEYRKSPAVAGNPQET